MLAVQNTFLHLVEAGGEEQPTLLRARTAPVPHSDDAKPPALRAESDESDDQPALSRETTFDEFEEPCDLGGSGEGTEDDSACTPQPDLSRNTTYDAFEVPCELGQGAGCEAASPRARLRPQGSSDSLESGGRDGAASAPPLRAPLPDGAPEGPRATPPPSHQPPMAAQVSLQPSVATMLMVPQVFSVGIGGLPAAWPLMASGAAAGHQVVAGHHGEAQGSQACPPSSAAAPAPPRGGSGSTQARPSKDVACTYPRFGVARVQWTADGRRFAGQAATAVSPGFLVDLPGLGPQPFKIVVHAAATSMTKGGSSFRAAGGHARIELKCEGQLECTAPSLNIAFGLGGGEMRGPLRHNFAEQSCCGLGKGEQAWDLTSAMDKRTKAVLITLEIARVEGRA